MSSVLSRTLAAVGTFGLAVLASCSANPKPQAAYRRYFLPPEGKLESAQPTPETLTPPPGPTLYANEIPSLSITPPPPISRPTDTDFLLRRAEDRFTAGKRAIQENRPTDARSEFNRAVEILLTAPENLPDRARVEKRLEELVDAIYRYDQNQLGAGLSEEEVTYDARPLDDILEMTFPIDPSLRGKVQGQIQKTVSELPLEESDAVVSYINFFSSTKGHRILVSGLKHSGRYKTMIARILAQEGVPAELIFVAQAESSFQPRAISKAKCVGVWQFAKFRGNEYGLNQTAATEDRMDPEKETRAAAHHLHDLYNHFGDWYLAMAAYNCGPGCVDAAVAHTGYADFWTLRRMGALPLETANYVPAILAMTIMAKNPSAYDLDSVDFEPEVQYDSLELQSPTHLALVAASVDRPISELKDLNPGLLKSVAPAGYTVHVPKGSLPQLEAALNVIPNDRRDTWQVHKVDSGETLESVARQHGTTLALLSAANHDELPEPGAFAAVPVSYTSYYPADRPAVVSKKPASKASAKAAPSKSSAKKAPAKTASKAPVSGKASASTRKPTSKPANHRAAGA